MRNLGIRGNTRFVAKEGFNIIYNRNGLKSDGFTMVLEDGVLYLKSVITRS